MYTCNLRGISPPNHFIQNQDIRYTTHLKRQRFRYFVTQVLKEILQYISFYENFRINVKKYIKSWNFWILIPSVRIHQFFDTIQDKKMCLKSKYKSVQPWIWGLHTYLQIKKISHTATTTLNFTTLSLVQFFKISQYTIIKLWQNQTYTYK